MYEDLIKESFESLGYKPLPHQPAIVNEVLTEFFVNGKKNVVLNAPVGVGKSILGAVISECVDQLIGSEDLPSMIMMSQNSLARQYAESFEHLGDQRYFQIKGKSN
jgi:excinuclease UvrABC helicase subunit UvrB